MDLRHFEEDLLDWGKPVANKAIRPAGRFASGFVARAMPAHHKP